MTVEVADSEDVSQAAQKALALTESLGGHVVSANVSTGDEGSATLTVRIPVAKVQDAIVQLSALGRIVSQQVTIDDLQATLDTLERREQSVRAQIAPVTARLESETLDAPTRALLEARLKTLRSELRQLRRDTAATSGGADGHHPGVGRHAGRPRGRPRAVAPRPRAGRGAQRPRLGRRRRAGDPDRRRAVRAGDRRDLDRTQASTGGGKRRGCSRRKPLFFL